MNIIICCIREFCVFFLDQDWKLVILEREPIVFFFSPPLSKWLTGVIKFYSPPPIFQVFLPSRSLGMDLQTARLDRWFPVASMDKKVVGTGQEEEEEETTKVSEWVRFLYLFISDGWIRITRNTSNTTDNRHIICDIYVLRVNCYCYIRQYYLVHLLCYYMSY